MWYTRCIGMDHKKTSQLPTNYQKHQTKNPVQRFLIDGFYRAFFACAREASPVRILDAGCGEGFTLHKLREERIGKTSIGIEYSSDSRRLGKKLFPEVDIRPGDIYHIQWKRDSFDLVVCTEVLEHLTDPSKALLELGRVSSAHILLSVPNEPWFMLSNFLRGKYLSRWGNHPEHINHWSTAAFIRFVEGHGYTIQKIAHPFPWTVILAKKAR